MHPYSPTLHWIKSQHKPMVTLLDHWSNINSWTDNLVGLSSMRSALRTAFASLDAEIHEIPLPPRLTIDSAGNVVEKPQGDALSITKHPSAPIRVFLGGHMDTVYPASHPFQMTEHVNDNILRGPGVTDMKGGLVVLLKSLEALEQSPFAGKIGWEVLINSDEETGSTSSKPLLVQCARRNHIGLLFEPSLPDGSIVSARKGSMNYTVIARGKTAHAGRDFHKGRNAISALARFIINIEALNDIKKEITVNVGRIEGGEAINIVPDLAVCHFNIRMRDPEDMPSLIAAVEHEVEAGQSQEGISLTLHENAVRPPKPFNDMQRALFDMMQDCGKDLDLDLQWKPSGGVCDGNILFAEGLPTIDTLGVIGDHIHTSEEYVLLDSLTERAALTTYFFMKLANQEIVLPSR